jgi:putative sporulation protein YyaC
MRISFLRNKLNRQSRAGSKVKYLPKDTYMKVVDFFKDDIKQDAVIVCIGTNRSNLVDCLGPFVGSLLKEDKEFKIPVYGSMVSPIHALNLTKRITEIKNNHPHSKIVAVDAALSREDEIGKINLRNEPLQPGRGSGNNCGEVGDVCIKGIVAPEGADIVYYNTDLSFISAMAYTIAKGLKEAFR